MLREVALVCMGVVWFVNFAVAQVSTGTISGVVRDETGGVIPGAVVRVSNVETGIARNVSTNAQGRYTAPSLTVGDYELQAEAAGFRVEVRRGIRLTVGRQAVVDFALQVGSVAESVEVTGEAPLVETTTSSLSNLVDDQTIRDLPLNGRSYDQLALLQTGVVSYTLGSSRGFGYGAGTRMSVAGGRSYSNAFLLDGTDINDHANSTPGGAAGSNLGVDAIREFKIVTNSFAAEYGRATGAVVSAVTKTGTNQFHGSAFEFHRNDDMDARNFFDPGVPPFVRNQFGGVLGGPIVRDKAFFFGGYEGLRQRKGNTIRATVPTVAAKNGILPDGTVINVNPVVQPFLRLYPDPNDVDYGNGTARFVHSPSDKLNQDYVMGRVDYRINDAHSMFGRYSFDDDEGDTPLEFPAFFTLNAARRQYSTIQLTSILSPTLLNNFRFAYNRSFQESDDLPREELGPEYSFVPGRAMGVIQFSQSGSEGVITNLGTGNSVPRWYAYNLFEWGDDLSYIKGSHSLKFGGYFKRMRDNSALNSDYYGRFDFTTLENFLRGSARQFRSVPLGLSAYRANRQSLIAAYVQDDFQVSPRLTLNLGLRYEVVTNPHALNGLTSRMEDPLGVFLTEPEIDSYHVTDKNIFEPRVGFAWSMNASGTTVLRGGTGFFHDQILPQVYTSQTAKYPPFYERLVARNAPFPGGFVALQSGAVSDAKVNDPFANTPSKIHWNLSVQQQFSDRIVVEVAYVGAKASHLTRFAEQNYPNYTTLADGRKCFNYEETSAGDDAFNPSCPNGPVDPRNPNYGETPWLLFDTDSLYNGLQFKFRHSMTSGAQFQFLYTLSRTMDEASGVAGGDQASAPQGTVDPEDSNRQRGRSNLDALNNVVISYSYPLPFQFQSRAASMILGGWELSGISTITSGRPMTVRTGFDHDHNLDGGDGDRPDLIPGGNQNPVSGVTAGCAGIDAGEKLGTPNRWYDPCQFQLAEEGFFGNSGRNTVLGPGLFSIDFSVHKNIPLTEGANLQFRAEFFNLLNRANFGLPITAGFETDGARLPTAGIVNSTTTTGREIQLGLKLVF